MLPIPIIVHELYPRFMAAVCLEDEVLRNSYFNTIINTLPEMHRETLKVLLCHLRKIADRAEVNKMSEKNLSIVFGPLLLKKEGDDVKSFLQYSKYIIKSATNLIESYHQLFVVGAPIRTIKSTFDHIAEKPGELDLKQNAIIHIFRREGEDWFGETEGRFATFSQRFLDRSVDISHNPNAVCSNDQENVDQNHLTESPQKKRVKSIISLLNKRDNQQENQNTKQQRVCFRFLII